MTVYSHSPVNFIDITSSFPLIFLKLYVIMWRHHLTRLILDFCGKWKMFTILIIFLYCINSHSNITLQPHQNCTHFLSLLVLSLFSLSLSLFLSEFLSVFLCAPLLKTVSALLLLHQKAVAKWRLTSAAATEEGLCVFSSWGQIPLKRAKLRSTISHCNENPNFNQQDHHFQ